MSISFVNLQRGLLYVTFPKPIQLWNNALNNTKKSWDVVGNADVVDSNEREKYKMLREQNGTKPKIRVIVIVTFFLLIYKCII